MAKTIQSKKDALAASICDLTTPRLCLLSAFTAETIHDPSTWTEVTQYATTNRPSLAGKIPTISAASTNTSDSPDTVQIQFPTSDHDCTAVSGSQITVVAIAIVDGTAALSSSTKGRVVDIVDKVYQVGDIPRFAANSWTAKE